MIKRKDNEPNSFWWTSVVNVIFEVNNDIAAVKILAWKEPKEFIELFTKDAIRWDLILNWFEPNDYL